MWRTGSNPVASLYKLRKVLIQQKDDFYQKYKLILKLALQLIIYKGEIISLW